MKLKRLKNWFAKHRKHTIIIGISSVIVLGTALIAILNFNPAAILSRTDPNVAAEEQEELIVPSPLSGLPVSKDLAQRPVTAIIIENSPAARPQSGLRSAGVLFEAIAEGGITRYVALFQENRPDPIGPVRSLRPYFIDWILAYDASAAFIGGSAQAITEAAKQGIKSINQFHNSQYYWRATDRYAPHNVYTNFKRLDEANKVKGFKTSDFDTLPRQDEAPRKNPAASTITLDISSYLYEVEYRYNKKNNNYSRFLAGAPHIDRNSSKQLTPKVVVALEVPHSIDPDGRYQYDLVGSGKMTVFQNGGAAKGTWSRNARNKQFTFKDKAGELMKFNRGQIWFTAVNPGGGGVTWVR